MQIQKVIIDGNECTKMTMQGALCVSVDYRMTRVDSNGKETRVILDKKIHRLLISRIEAKIAQEAQK